MELLLGVNALLGNQGGVTDGSGSSGWLFRSGTYGSDVDGTQFLLSKGSGGFIGNSGGEVISGSNLHTGEWGNGIGEIHKECTGTGEIVTGSSDLFTSNCLPSGGSLEFLVGGDGECYLGCLSGFSGTNGSCAPACVACFGALVTDGIEVGVQGSKEPVTIPEVGLGSSSSVLLCLGDVLVSSSTGSIEVSGGSRGLSGGINLSGGGS